ncbi:MAG: DUF92 domain-containing protein [Ignavibacteria bacterium]|nr:DUF92 domain-containing protein [Ignavibacteria bacterium]
MPEYYRAIIIVLSISLLIFLLEICVKKNILASESARKILHLITGFLIAFSPRIFDSNFYPIIISSIASAFTFLAVRYNWLKIDSKNKSSYGTFYFSFAFMIMTLLFWDKESYLITFSYLIFTVSDAAAAVFGSTKSKKNLLLINDEPKTIQGALAYFVSSFLILWTLWFFYNEFIITRVETTFNYFILVFLISVIGMVVEILSKKGSDNFFLPITISILLKILFDDNELLINFVLAFGLSSIVAFLSFKFGFLTKSGVLSAFIMAFFIFGIGGWLWTIPIFTFFVLSSLLSKLNSKNEVKLSAKFQKGSQRDLWQVFANGGLPLLLCLLSYFSSESVYYLLYLCAIAVATADTWSTEIGTMLSKNTYLITNLSKIEKGSSGGISLIGTIGGLIGSIIVVLTSMFFIKLDLSILLTLILSGLIGSLIDSVIGATLQANYLCEQCNVVTERTTHCGSNTKLVRGHSFINNDFVNFSSAFITVVIVYLVLK